MLSVKPIGPVLAVQLNWTRSVSSPSKLAPPMMPNGISPLTPSYCDSNKPAVNPPRVTYALSAQIVATTPFAESPRKLMTLVNMPQSVMDLAWKVTSASVWKSQFKSSSPSLFVTVPSWNATESYCAHTSMVPEIFRQVSDP